MKFFIPLLVALFVAFSAAAANVTIQPENVDSITVLASSSLTVPVTEISKLYSRTKNIDVNAVYESSNELFTKIEEGEPADIIITPSMKLINQLKEHGLIDAHSKIILAGNRLVIVASREMEFPEDKTDIKEILEAVYNKTIMVIGDTNSTSVGEFTREALQSLDMWKKFERRVMLGSTSSRTTDLIIKGQSAGITYATDAKLYAGDIKVLGEIPQNMHQPIEYYAAIVVGDNMDKAREYLSYLTSEQAKQVLKSQGFVVK